jgi:hypothetical protein
MQQAFDCIDMQAYGLNQTHVQTTNVVNATNIM